MRQVRTAACVLVLLLLAGCASRQIAPEEVDRGWLMVGRLALSDGRNSGSGTLEWQHSAQASQMHFHGALGRGAWSLNVTESAATLETADGRQIVEPSVSLLIDRHTALNVPVHGLEYWVLGRAAPGAVAANKRDENGDLILLEQMGWEIKFRQYRDVDQQRLPRRVEARQGDQFVKLLVREWTFAGGKSQNL